MNIFKHRFRVITLSCLLSLSLLGGISLAQELETTDNCENPFSLYESLEEAGARDASGNVLIPRGLPGSAKSQNIGAEGAIKGFTGLIQRFINGLTAIAAAVAVFFIVFNAGSMMLAAGEEDKIKKAKTGVTWALLGLLLIMSSYIIAKTVISLTYSGSSEIVDGSNEFNKNCNTETEPDSDPVVEVVTPAPKPQACEAGFLDEIPDACYTGDTSGIQSSTGTCNSDNLGAAMNKVCVVMKTAKDLDKNADCTIENVQRALGAEANGPGFYADPGAACSRADGKYGQCTHEALSNYLGAKCS